MAEQTSEVDFDFNPAEFLVPEGWFIDRTFWEHLDENCSAPSSPSCGARFYVPRTRALRGWPERLRQHFGVEPFIAYDPAVLNLPNEITAEEIEAGRLECNKYVVESVETMKPVPPPDKLSVQEYLKHKSLSLIAHLAFGGKFENLTEKEQRITRWTEDYGFLWDHRDGKGLLFPGPRDDDALKFEIITEYFFYVKQFPQLILSVGQEPNSDRAIYGFRREASLDWPFDTIWVGVEQDEQGKPRAKYAPIPDETVERDIVNPMNRLIRNIEYVIGK